MGLTLSILVFIDTFMSKVRCISANTPISPLYSSVVRSFPLFSSLPEHQLDRTGWLVPMISLGGGGPGIIHWSLPGIVWCASGKGG